MQELTNEEEQQRKDGRRNSGGAAGGAALGTSVISTKLIIFIHKSVQGLETSDTFNSRSLIDMTVSR